MSYVADRRKCWRYQHGCRQHGALTTRIGAHVIVHCPDHQPRRKEQA